MSGTEGTLTKINVEDATAGVIIMNGLIGNCMEMFEITVHEGSYHYWVREVEVPVEIYRDALELARLDRYEPIKTEAEPEATTKEPDVS